MGHRKVSRGNTKETRVSVDKISAGKMHSSHVCTQARTHRRLSAKTKREKLYWRGRSGWRDDFASDAANRRYVRQLWFRPGAADTVAKLVASRCGGRLRRNRKTTVGANRVSLRSDQHH